MSAPFTPEDAKALISDPTSSMCGNFVKTLLRLPVLFYQFVSAFVDADGNWIRTVEPGDYIYSAAPLAESAHRKLCNGQELSKTTYAVLYAAIGDVYATMDGQSAPATGNFRVPKASARFALAVGTLPSSTAVSLGSVGGEEKHTLTEAELAPHDHDLSVLKHSDTTHENDLDGLNADFTGSSTPLVKTDVACGDGAETPAATPHNTMPPYFGAYVYISTGI